MNNFTPRAQQTLALARKEADKLNHNYVGTEHLLLGLLKLGEGTALSALSKFNLDLEVVRAEVMKLIGSPSETKMVGNIPYTPSVKKVLALASKEARALNHSYVGSEHILLGLLSDKNSAGGRVLEKFGITIENLRNEILIILDPNFTPVESEGELRTEYLPLTKKQIKTPAIKAFCKDLTAMAVQGLLNATGREADVDRIARVLARSTRNNPVIIGPPRVGKSSVIHLLAKALAANRWPFAFADRRLVQLDIGLLVAGTKYRGQMEERIKAVLDEVRRVANIIVIIEDIPLVIEDELEASVFSFVRHELSDGQLQCIFTAQEEEFQLMMRKSRWLEPLIQQVYIDSTTNEDTLRILNGKRSTYEISHNVRFTDDALKLCVELSELYLVPRREPVNALSLLDESSSWTRFERDGQQPTSLKELELQIADLRLKKEVQIKSQDFEGAVQLRAAERDATEKLNQVYSAWRRELESVVVRIDGGTICQFLSQRTGIPEEKIRNREQLPPSYFGMDTHSIVSGAPKFERLQTESVLQGQGVEIERATGFVLMPHTDEFRNIFDLAIKPAMDTHGIVVKKAEDIYKPGSILAQVWERVRKAEIIVADLTDKNPNVIFELGLCYGIQRCPILLVKDAADVPFNLRNLRYIEYENSIKGADELRKKLTSTIAEFLAQVRTPPEEPSASNYSEMSTKGGNSRMRLNTAVSERLTLNLPMFQF